RPNRYFPQPPKLPPGSPPALLRDESSGEMKPARVNNWDSLPGSNWHYVQIGQQNLPPVCCRCLKATPNPHPHSITETTQLEIPFCEECARKSERAFQRIWLTAALLGSLAGWALAAAVAGDDSYWFWVIVVSCSFVSVCVAVYAASVMTAPAKVKV